jgi:hypothetical protein
MPDEKEVVNWTSVRDNKAHLSKSQALKSCKVPSQVFDRGLYKDAMLLQKAVEFIAGLDSQQPPKLGFGDPTGLVFFESEPLKRPTRQIYATGREALGEIVRNRDTYVHLPTI